MGAAPIVREGTWNDDLVVARCLQAKPKEAGIAQQVATTVLRHRGRAD